MIDNGFNFLFIFIWKYKIFIPWILYNIYMVKLGKMKDMIKKKCSDKTAKTSSSSSSKSGNGRLGTVFVDFFL